MNLIVNPVIVSKILTGFREKFLFHIPKYAPWGIIQSKLIIVKGAKENAYGKRCDSQKAFR